MRISRAILVICAVWGIVCPRMLLPCCEGGPAAEKASALTPAAGDCASCCEAVSVASHSQTPHDSDRHGPTRAPHGCTGCGLTCCAKVLVAHGPFTAHLPLAQTGVLPGTCETLPSRLLADGIFRPPRALTV